MIDLIRHYKWWLFGIILLGGLVIWFERWQNVRDHQHDEAILAAGAKYHVDPALVKAVIWKESGFDAKARGRSGEIGLMQIMNATASDWAESERIKSFSPSRLYDPGENAQCGAWYLHRLLRRYRDTDNPLVYALAAYNAGPTTITKWTKGPGATNSAEFLRHLDYPGTKNYVESILKRYRHYGNQFKSATGGASNADGSIHRELPQGRFQLRADSLPLLFAVFSRNRDWIGVSEHAG
jgi:soluble lytic murein transglycosylase